MTSTPNTLVLLRHGESEWNAKNLFTGWVDVPLNEKGRQEAVRGGERELRRRDRALEHRGVDDVGQQVVLGEQLSAACGLGAADVGERDVDPPGEEIGLVPLALAVAEQHQRSRSRHAVILPDGDQGASWGQTSQSS